MVGTLDENKSKYKGIINGVPFTCDEPKIILGELVDSVNDLKKFKPNIEDNVLKYNQMGYTTDIRTMGLIFKNKTFRATSLSSAKLNDKMEKSRKGIAQYAGSRLITCFTHMNHESIPFWAYYGGNDKTQKVQLIFDNFVRNFEDLIYTDYALLDREKIFFYSDEYKNTVNVNATIGRLAGLMPINEDYNIRNYIRSISVFDVQYVPVDDDVFKKNYSTRGMVKFDNAESNSIKLEISDPECLGRHKSEPWNYECETRIMICLGSQEFDEWSYIDLRLKDEIFRNLKIIMSPWVNDEAEDAIKKAISESGLSQDIIDSITIRHSVVEGTLNF